MEELLQNNYYIFLRISFSNSDVKYYSFCNNSNYQETTYYTIKKNNKLLISFNNYNNISYMNINVNEIDELPEKVYDIAIDVGTTKEKQSEEELILKCGNNLKNMLENEGLKVFFARTNTEKKDNESNMYDEDGRINVLNSSHAKVLISLDLNNSSYSKKSGGVEIYAPSNSDLSFAKTLAHNIVQKASTSYSKLKSFKVEDGVYVRNFTNLDIQALKNRAIRNNFEPYDINTSTPYLYIIRETGGIATSAYVDGRNSSFGKNNYYKSNTGIETYLITLGYSKIEDDINNIASNYISYMEGIRDAIKEML